MPLDNTVLHPGQYFPVAYGRGIIVVRGSEDPTRPFHAAYLMKLPYGGLMDPEGLTARLADPDEKKNLLTFIEEEKREEMTEILRKKGIYNVVFPFVSSE